VEGEVEDEKENIVVVVLWKLELAPELMYLAAG
jgi:hypothetical protein